MTNTIIELPQLVYHCDKAGIRVTIADGDNLAIDAPTGSLTPDLVAALKHHKPTLLDLLRRTAERRETQRREIQAASGNPSDGEGTA